MNMRKKLTHIQIRTTEEEKEEIKANAKKDGFESVSDYLRFLGKVAKPKVEFEYEQEGNRKQ